MFLPKTKQKSGLKSEMETPNKFKDSLETLRLVIPSVKDNTEVYCKNLLMKKY